jgi:hypothetical protein
MGFSLNVNLGGFVEEVQRVSADFRVRTLPIRATGGVHGVRPPSVEATS